MLVSIPKWPSLPVFSPSPPIPGGWEEPSGITLFNNSSKLELLKASAVSVALEGESPSTIPEFMNDVRGDTDSVNRYSDQTLNLVVYKDGVSVPQFTDT